MAVAMVVAYCKKTVFFSLFFFFRVRVLVVLVVFLI